MYFVIHFWITILRSRCTSAATISKSLFQSASTNVTNFRSGNKRNVLLVLPVMQGSSNDPSDPRLQFWYTKPPITVFMEENLNRKESQAQPSVYPTTTPAYKEVDIVTTADIITTDLPFLDSDTSETKLHSLPTTQPFHQRMQNSNHNLSDKSPPSHHDIYVSFAKDKMKYFPSYSSTPQPNLRVISTESKWKSEILKSIENDKLEAQKFDPTSTVDLPSSTPIQYFSDFIPIQSNYRSPSSKIPQIAKFEKTTLKSSAATQVDPQYDFVKVYDIMKKISLNPLPTVKSNNVERIPSSDKEYFDVFREVAVPTESIYREPTKKQTFSTLKIPSTKVTDQWILSYGPKESVSLVEITDATPTEKNSSITSQASLMSFSSSTSITPSLTTADDKLTDDFEKMLVALGILEKSATSTTTTESNELWMNPESFTTDPLSYSEFKKIPIVEELSPIRTDMQSLLNSFGLLPKRKESENFPPVRVVRQSKSKKSNGRNSKFVRVYDKITEKSPAVVRNLFSAVKTRFTKPQNSKNLKKYEANFRKLFSETKTNIVNFPKTTFPENMTNVSTTSPMISQHSNKLSYAPTKLPTLAVTFATLPSTMRKISATKQSKKSISSSTTMKPKRANINDNLYKDLANSFGGGETAENDPEELTTPNGLYFLVDWNKFLITGDDDDAKPIRLRFSPHVGDPRLFIPIDFP